MTIEQPREIVIYAAIKINKFLYCRLATEDSCGEHVF